MSKIFIGTESGVFWLNGAKDIQREEGPSNVKFLATAREKVLAIAPENALWERTDKSGWQLINSQTVQEEVWAFTADPRIDGRLYLGVSPAMLYISDNGGKSWTACESIRRIPGYETWTFPPPPHIPLIRFIAPDPQVAGSVYIGVEEGGVYRSSDRGQTWESLNEGLYWDIHTVTPATDGVHLYATTGAGFHRSDDGGHHWQRIIEGMDRRYAVPLVASPKRPKRLYTAAAATPPPGWAKGGANAALYRSDDGGDRWIRLEQGLPPQFNAMVRSLALDEAGGVYAAAGNELFASFDEGDTWQLIAGNLPLVQALAAIGSTSDLQV